MYMLKINCATYTIKVYTTERSTYYVKLQVKRIYHVGLSMIVACSLFSHQLEKMSDFLDTFRRLTDYEICVTFIYHTLVMYISYQIISTSYYVYTDIYTVF